MSYHNNRRFKKNSNCYYSDEEDNDYYYENDDYDDFEPKRRNYRKKYAPEYSDDDYDYEPKRRNHRSQYVPDYSDDEYEDSDILDEQLGYNLQDKKDYNYNRQQRRGRGRGRGRGDYHQNRFEDERNYRENQKRFDKKPKDSYYNNRQQDNFMPNQRRNKNGGRGKYYDYKSNNYNDKKYYDDNYYRGREREDNYNNYERNAKGGKEYKTYNNFERTGKGKHYEKNERTSEQTYHKRGGQKSTGNNKKNFKYQEREIEITDSTPLEINANSHSGPTIKIMEKKIEEPLPKETPELNIHAAEFYPQSFKNRKNQ